ncbi:YidC/Oxa1 family insertase periplasmic-domain containing protein [Tautonia rosea]|uniref:YidC/Oxa1 family insertase periplasmic-domain containing protein n=1 Tax=Tautonia rosea TaxID=2728037 RepID=UPI001473F96E|nr:YidC/Oxa1 family insertase periplasmic-domain containing protein [Tautonia rosea]
MSTEPNPSQDPKRLFLFMILSLILITGTNYTLSRLGLLPEREPEAPQAAEADLADPNIKPDAEELADAVDPAGDRSEAASGSDAPVLDSVASAVEEEQDRPAATVDPGVLILGSVEESETDGYHLQVVAEQRGASVRSIRSAQHNAEYQEGEPRKRPMTLVRSVIPEHRPLAVQLLNVTDDGVFRPISDLDRRLWQVLVGGVPFEELDEAAQAEADPVAILRDDQGNEIGQQLSFRTTIREPADLPPVVVTKTYRLLKGTDTVALDLTFELPDGVREPRELLYRLDGPSGIPIEGEWYTHTFRNSYFGKGKEGNTVEVVTYSSYDVAKNPEYYINNVYPTIFAGVENQYFATFLKPEKPADQVAEAVMTVVDADPNELKKADVAVDLISKPVEVEPGSKTTHSYDVFAGPKTETALLPFGAEELGIYRQVGRIPVIGWLLDLIWAIVDPIVALLSVYIIIPLLAGIYSLTETIAGWFGGTRGSYGIAIILLTVVVRLALFPLSRKQAASAKKMQDLAPHMAALREKYKDDREKIAQETFALYRKYGINPLGGCLPVFIQIPIFMTLWRVLNVSVSLRQAQFLWIDNLAAPDMLYKLPFTLPLLGPYFNLLPLGVIGLFLLQMKLFTPPATTPEQEAQQRIMKFMMVFMMLMFYRVPAGLALYFITSSVWSISERLLLPKVSKTPTIGTDGEEGPDRDGKGRGPGGSDKGPDSNGGSGGWLSRKLNDLLQEASKETTYRREELERKRRELERSGASSTPGPGPDPSRSRPNKKKTKPGKRR